MSHSMLRAIEVLRSAPEHTPCVAFVGDASRTRYVDHDTVMDVLEILRDARIYRPVHGGKPPFDLYLEEICARVGLMDIMVGPADKKARLEPYKRPADILDGCCMLVAFPPEGGKVRDADPEIVDLALVLGIPVLSVDRKGSTRWTT